MGAEAGCPYFTGRLVRGVVNKPSPEWLQNLLLSVGLKPISALVDVTNYLLYEYNRPLHVFDASKIKGAITGGITVRLAGEGESFTALNGKDYSAPAGSVVIADDAGILALGGVMGGLNSGVTMETTNVFIEAAYFTPAAVARAGRLLNLLSDSRSRFERGIDPQSCLTGLEMATHLIIELCGGEASEIVSVGTPLSRPSAIAYHPSLVEKLGGLAITDQEQESILTKLGFAVVKSNPWQVTPPSWRGDCRQPADLVEEVLRIADYDRIPLTPLPRPPNLPSRAIGIATARTMRLRRNLAERGFDEVVSWAFLDRRDAVRFGGGDAGLTLLNPIASDLSDMRPTPMPNLLAAASRNLARGESCLAQFEIGPGFRDATDKGQKNLAVAVRVETSSAKDWLSKDSDPTGFFCDQGGSARPA